MDDSADPTELAGAAEAETQSAYAWALDEAEDYPTQRITPRRITSVAIAASLVAIAGAGVIAYVHLRGRPAPAPVAAPTTTTTTTTPVAAPQPSQPPVTVTTVVIQPPPPAPQAAPIAPVMSNWTYEVNWGGAPTITVIEHASGQTRTRYVSSGEYLGVGTGWTGDLIGADPVIDGAITWATCTLYVDGVAAKSDSAVRGDGHDVSCLVRLTR